MEPDDAREPLYAEARDLLSSPAAAAIRASVALKGGPADVSWLTDDAMCNQIRRTLRQKPGDPPLAAVRVGNRILVQARPRTARYLFDQAGNILLVLDVLG